MAQAKKKVIEAKKAKNIVKELAIRQSSGFSLLFIGMLIGSLLTAIYMGYLMDPMKGLGSGIYSLIESRKKPNLTTLAVPDVDQQDENLSEETVKIQYDYYTILPEIERLITDAPQQPIPSVIKSPEQTTSEKSNDDTKIDDKLMDDVAAAENKPQEVVTNETPTEVEAITDKSTYFVLQAASYANENDAEQLKDEIALSGYHAFVQKVTIDGKNYFRVRMGPFYDYQRMEKAKQKLVDRGLKPLPLEVEKTP